MCSRSRSAGWPVNVVAVAFASRIAALRAAVSRISMVMGAVPKASRKRCSESARRASAATCSLTSFAMHTKPVPSLVAEIVISATRCVPSARTSVQRRGVLSPRRASSGSAASAGAPISRARSASSAGSHRSASGLPIIASASWPRIRAAPRLNTVIVPVPSAPMMICSEAASMRFDRRSLASRTSRSACRARVTSRTVRIAPPPVASSTSPGTGVAEALR